MKPWAYYNEIEPAAAHVLRALIAANVIAPGEVDERSIIDVRPDDLRGFSQCHFFAGGGLWSVAARLAGWPDERPLWTGSCPCQPFSVAGKGRGADDPRHLWPDFFRLIRACRPPVVVGEQVAGAAGYGWFDGVSADLEGEGYASRAVDIPACAVDAPHIRQRLYWVALGDARQQPSERNPGGFHPSQAREHRAWVEDGAVAFGSANAGVSMGHAESLGRRGRQDDEDGRRRECAPADTGAGECELADADKQGRQGRQLYAERTAERAPRPDGVVNAARERRGEGIAATEFRGGRDAAAGASFWHDAELRIGADGKARRVKPGVRLLVDGLPGRVGLLRIGGNGIVPQVAAEVLAALMDDAAD